MDGFLTTGAWGAGLGGGGEGEAIAKIGRSCFNVELYHF